MRTLLILALVGLALLPSAAAVSAGATADAPQDDSNVEPSGDQGPPCVRRTSNGGFSTHVEECLAS